MIATRRFLPLLLLTGLVAIVAFGCGGGKSSPSSGSTAATSNDVSGTYVVVQDSNGTKPKPGVTVTLVLDKGSLSVHAVGAGDELTDSGTYSISGGKMTIEFKDQGISAKDQPYKLDGDTLELPVKMFSEGAGSSTWKRSSGQATSKSTPAAATALKSDWSRWDLNKNAAAAGTKHFVEAVNDKGTAWEQAVTETAAYVRTLPDVTDAKVSSNGLNITIRYKDGTGDYVVTERQDLVSQASTASDAPPSQRLVSAEPMAAGAPQSSGALTNAGCAKVPGSPTTARPPEPGREGVNPAGGYGVAIYDPNAQPKPVTSADTPPKRALILAPAYDIAHPLRGHGRKVELVESFKSAVGPTIECVEANLTSAGYTIDPILGHEENGKNVNTGDQAAEQLGKQLAANKYGAFYVMSHGTNIDSYLGFVSESWMYLGLMDLERPELKKAVNGRRLDAKVDNHIVKALAGISGLTWDGSGDPPFIVGAEFQGSAVIWVTPAFFKMLRAQKSVSFDQTLVFLNTCSSAANATLREAMQPKAFFGWTIPMGGSFASDAAETLFDSLTDKARSARDAWWMWRRHEAWQIDKEGKPRTDNEKPEQLKAFGVNGAEYEPITSQSLILIHRLRNGPSSASSDIAKSMLVVKSCSELFWSLGKKTGLASPACHQLEFGNELPTTAEVDDALFEVGGPVQRPYGRWTLAD